MNSVCVFSHSVVSNSLQPLDCSPSSSSVHGILQARILERVTIPFSRGFSWRSNWTWFSCIAGGFFTFWATREAYMNSNTDKLPSWRTERLYSYQLCLRGPFSTQPCLVVCGSVLIFWPTQEIDKCYVNIASIYIFLILKWVYISYYV